MERNFKLSIEYDGTRFHGWQRQKNDRTVQGEIEAALRRMKGAQSTRIAEELMERVTALDDPDLDNVSFSIVQLREADGSGAALREAAVRPDIRCVG